jgi:hypothetical protein
MREAARAGVIVDGGSGFTPATCATDIIDDSGT